jgi:CO/xanthine dehydrogenase Mo-binding subunit
MIPNTLPQSLIDNPRLDQWVAFEEGNRVRISTGKVELGQGILTALVQIAADELDVDFAQVDVVSGATPETPSEGFTSGSNSIAVSGASLRLVCAEVRALLLERAAEKLAAPIEALRIEDGRVLRDGRDCGLDYWSLRDEVDLSRAATGSAPTKKPSDYRVVGRSLPRLDLPAKLTDPAFIHDINPEDVIHARVLHRPWPGACLAAVDESAIRRAAKEQVRLLREGDMLAVIGEEEMAVMRAIEAARSSSQWENGTPLPDGAGDPDWLIQQPARSRVIGSERASHGRQVLEAVYARPFLAHASIAPSCALADYRAGYLRVWTHSQGVFVLRDWLARILKLPVARVAVFHRQGAGCYGHNAADDAAFDAAFIATRVPDRTIRVQWTREDELAVAPIGAAMAVRIRAVLDPQNRPADWTLEIWSPVHGRRPGMGGGGNLLSAEALPEPLPIPPIVADVPDAIGGGATRNGEVLYDLPRRRLIHHLLPEVPVRSSTIRGLGAQANIFAIESFMDELAEAAGEDAVAYRLSLMSDPRARRVMERAAEMAGWFDHGQKGEGTALGFGFGRYKNRAAYVAVVAEVAVEEEVRACKVWCAVDAGLVINPDGAANQVEGGIIQAVSWTLKEEVRFADGRVTSDTWETYPILTFPEVPEVELEFLESPLEPALGLGEAAVGPTSAALGNAVARALGARIRRLPLSRERIVETLTQSE